jgi:hypothetical protein
MSRFPRFRLIFLAPVLAAVALLGWGLASPMGASPDDDFHLTSIWCSSLSSDANCTAGTNAAERRVPQSLLESACYVPDPKTSAGCQESDVDFDPTATELTQRGNFVGGYPPVYYAAMGIFVGPDIVASVLAMRIANIVLFVALTSVIFALLPAPRRPPLVWGWLVTTIPLGAFLIPSNNPSGWAILGVGTAWIALLGWFETSGRRKIGLGVAFAVATVIASGARGDGALYVALGIAIVLGLTFRPTRAFLINAILPIAMLAVCVYFFISAQQVLSGLNGFGGVGSSASGVPRPVANLLAFNLLNVPTLWAGVFGSWGLGWLEVAMPAVVALGSLACFVLVAVVGFGRLSWRKAVAVGLVGLALIAVPVLVLTRGGDVVGEEVQPRYLLPLIVLLAGLLLLPGKERPVRFARGQVLLVVITLAVVQFIALHVTMRRYITGTDDQGFDLNSAVEWWWDIPASPMVVLVVSSVAYGALVWILAREVTSGGSARRGANVVSSVES